MIYEVYLCTYVGEADNKLKLPLYLLFALPGQVRVLYLDLIDGYA